MKIYLVMAKSRVKGTEKWDTTQVVMANKSKEAAEKDVDKWNKEDEEYEYLQTFYYVEEVNLY